MNELIEHRYWDAATSAACLDFVGYYFWNRYKKNKLSHADFIRVTAILIAAANFATAFNMSRQLRKDGGQINSESPPWYDRMKYRKLRIAWSVAWGIAAVLLVELWIRSHWVYDDFHFSVVGGWSKLGTVCFVHDSVLSKPEWLLYSIRFNNSENGLASKHSFPLTWKYRTGYVAIWLSYWLLAAGCATAAVLPWFSLFRVRFSLRTLLIAMTLVAAGLELIIWLTR